MKLLKNCETKYIIISELRKIHSYGMAVKVGGLQPTLNGKPMLALRLFPCTVDQQINEVKIEISVVCMG